MLSCTDLELLAATTQSTQKFSLKGRIVEAKCIDVHDGDTARFAFRLIKDQPICWWSVHMLGYNSAELRSADPEEVEAGRAAKAHLESLILGKIVALHLGDFDLYGRPLGTVYLNRVNINQQMLDSRHGFAYSGRGEKRWR